MEVVPCANNLKEDLLAAQRIASGARVIGPPWKIPGQALCYHTFWRGTAGVKLLASIKSCYLFNVAGREHECKILLWTDSLESLRASTAVYEQICAYATVMELNLESLSEGTSFL